MTRLEPEPEWLSVFKMQIRLASVNELREYRAALVEEMVKRDLNKHGNKTVPFVFSYKTV
jgi:hypothetical protein